MQPLKLPATFRGYPTEELLEIQEALSTLPLTERLREIARNASPAKVGAAQEMVWKFQLTGAAQLSAQRKAEREAREHLK